MKYIHLYALFLMLVCHASCGQNQAGSPQDNFSKTHNGYSEPQLKKLADSQRPMAQVRHIKQAGNGDILIAASWSGAFRYDGKSFINLTNKLGAHRYRDILEDRRRNIWLASLDSGVYYYNGKTFQHFTTAEGLANNSAACIYEDKAGVIWFGTGGGLTRYDGKSFQNFTTKDGLPNNDLTTIMEDRTGKLWIGTRGAACFYDGKTFTVFTDKDGKTFNNLWSIIEDKKGNIWFGADGLWRYDGQTFTKVSQRGVYAIIQDKKGNIWTTGSIDVKVWTLSRYDAKSLYDKMPTVTDITTGPPAFLGLLEANDGSIWFGSGTGLHHYDGKTITDFKNAEEHPKLIVTRGNRYTHVECGLQDKNGNIWFSNWGGAYRYDGKSFTGFTKSDGLPDLGLVTRIIEDKKGDLWFGGSGLSRYDGRSFTSFTTKDGLSNQDVWSILEDKSGNLWVGSGDTGLYLYDGKTFIPYSEYKH